MALRRSPVRSRHAPPTKAPDNSWFWLRAYRLSGSMQRAAKAWLKNFFVRTGSANRDVPPAADTRGAGD